MEISGEISVASSMGYLYNVANDVTSSNRRARRSVGTSSLMAQHIDSSMTTKLRLQGDSPNYLQAPPSSTSLTLGPHTSTDMQACFRLHSFQVLSATPIAGLVVMVEAMEGNRFLQGSSSGTLSLIAGSSGGVSGVTRTDERFFVIQQNPGDRYCYVRHLHSGLLLSASVSGVSLVSHSGTPLDHMLFERFPCTHT